MERKNYGKTLDGLRATSPFSSVARACQSPANLRATPPPPLFVMLVDFQGQDRGGQESMLREAGHVDPALGLAILAGTRALSS